VPQICLVNLIDLDPPRNGGTSRIALAVTRLLLDHARRGELKVLVAVGRRFASRFAAWVGDEAPDVLPCLDDPGPVLRALRPDLIVSPLFGPGPLHQVDALRSTPHVVSMADAYALDFPEALPAEETRRRRALYQALADVTRVVTTSEYSRGRLLHHLPLAPGAVAVVPPGVDPPPPSAKAPPVEGRFLLYPAQDWTHKRHGFLLAVMDDVWRSSPDLTLVLTGWHGKPVGGERRTGHPAGRVVDLGYVADDVLRDLYERAEALVFPSSFEGFGLPVLEAMAAGCPVVCSDLEVLQELAGDAALRPAADSVPAWVRTIVDELPSRRTELARAGRARAAAFSPARMRSGWGAQLRAAGLSLGGSSAWSSPAVPVADVQAELLQWADLAHHADDRLEVIAGLQAILKRRQPVPGSAARSLTAFLRSALARLRRA
jgi:glycosyltransferase involved in cell wall biosynthesis